MRKLIVFLLVLVSCNRDGKKIHSNASQEVVSPSGVVFAKNRVELARKANIQFNRNDIVITNIEFKESSDISAAYIYVASKNGDMSSNFVIVKRIPNKMELMW